MNAVVKEIRALSVGAWFDPVVSVGIITCVFFALYQTAISDVYLALFTTLLTSAYLFLSELSRAPWRFAERPQQVWNDVFDRTITKFFGVLTGTLFIFFIVWLFPAYDNVLKLAQLKEAAFPTLAFIVPVSFIVILCTELVLGEKRDGTYQFGLLARLRTHEIDWKIFFDGLREWILRTFFVLINFYASVWYIAYLRTYGLPNPADGFATFIMRLDLMIFGAIVLSILPGYVFASRLIGTELKKVDRTWFGWAINFSCYPPLNAAVFAAWIRYAPPSAMDAVYGDTPAWAYHTMASPFFFFAVGGFIIFFAFIHLWGEAIVGIRAANMSMRGIITTAPFNFTRHPIYVSKCFQWAFLYFPVLNAIGFLNAVQSGILFLLVCAVYTGRALSEERLLATNDDYVKYALYMDEKSIFAWVGRLAPFMTFRWRLDYWKRNNLLQY